jgi:hypothetical protein
MTPAAMIAVALDRRSAIVRLDVVHLHDHAASPVAIAPEALDRLEGAFRHRIVDPDVIDAALAVIAATTAAPQRHRAELRWKLSFRDRDGRSVLELWHESFEPYGRIGSAEVRFASDGILRFLRARFVPLEGEPVA